MVGKATSEGQKVNLGQNAPIYQEGTGNVASDSLAAESYREGGEFASNREAAPHETETRARQTEYGSGPASTGNTSSGGIPSSEQGQAAPTYVNNQFTRDEDGPHGKNLHEGGFAGSGPGNSIQAEPGSKHDPARLAEQKFNLKQTHQGTGTGPRQAGISGEQTYDALDPETSS